MNLRKKENGSNANTGQRSSRNSMIANAGIIGYMLFLGIRIPLLRVIDETGLALLAPAFECITLITLLFSFGISRTMTGLVRFRVKREQFKSASMIFHAAFRISALLSLVLALLLAALSGFVSETVALEAMSRKAIMAAAPAIILTSLVNVFRGYFSGNGFGVLVAHSQYIEKISMFFTVTFGAELLYDYGLKVAALLQSDLAAYAYGALGAVLGFMASELITLIYLLAVYVIYSGTWKKQLRQDTGRRKESNGEITGMLLVNSAAPAVAAVLANAFMLIDQRFFNYCMNVLEKGESRQVRFGAYYGKFAVLIGIGCAIVCLSVNGMIGRIVLAYEREEYHMMRERIAVAVKRLCIVALPTAIYLAVLSEAFVKGIYKEDGAQMIKLVRWGCVIIVFYGISFLFGQLMLKMRMIIELLLSLVVSFAVHFLAVVLFVRKGLREEEGIVYSVIAFTGILAVLCFFFSMRKLKFKLEWLYGFAFPAVSACVTGLLVMLLNRLLLSAAGNLITILVSLVIGILFYVLLLMILRVINEEELSRLPFGGLWIAIGKMLRVL